MSGRVTHAEGRRERKSYGRGGKDNRYGNAVAVALRTRLFFRQKKRQIGLTQRRDGGEEQIEAAEPLRRAGQPIHDATERQL